MAYHRYIVMVYMFRVTDMKTFFKRWYAEKDALGDFIEVHC